MTQQANIHTMNLALLRRFTSTGVARAARTDNALSLAEIAEAVGVSKATISKWERGLQVPRGEAAQRYAALIAELLTLESGDGE